MSVIQKDLNRSSVFFYPFSQTLIGEIKKRQKPALHHNFGYFFPLFQRKVASRWVMADWMKKNSGFFWQFFQVIAQNIEIDAVLFPTVIRVSFHTQSGSFENRSVVRPGRS